MLVTAFSSCESMYKPARKRNVMAAGISSWTNWPGNRLTVNADIRHYERMFVNEETPSRLSKPCPTQAPGKGPSQTVSRGRSGSVAARDRSAVTLSDAQLVIAREYGFVSWPKLRQHVERVLVVE